MDLGWLRRRRVKAPEAVCRQKPEAESAPIIADPTVLVERLDDDPKADAIITELGKCYEIIDLNSSGGSFKVVIDDAFEQDEAIVRLASALDDIDLDWQRHLSWPRSQS